MGESYKVDMSDFEVDKKDDVKIEEGIGVPCRVCAGVFRRIRLTWRYCASCGKGFCEGEHGSFSRGGRGTCIQCGPHA